VEAEVFFMFRTTFVPQSGASAVAISSSVKGLPVNILMKEGS
jgi:hypothetical protein